MTPRKDAFSDFDELIARQEATDPWRRADSWMEYVPDYALLAGLLALPVGARYASETGRLARGVDAWIAHELRRAGFAADTVFPRLRQPRVVATDVLRFIDRLPRRLRPELEQRLAGDTRIGRVDAKVLGRAYEKQVDVLISHWATGPELIVSTKSMVSSFANNLPNRFEEAYGDAKNLRGRFPQAAMGFLFLLRSTVLEDVAAFEKLLDMLRKLRAETDVYDTTALVLAEWSDPFEGVVLRNDAVPEDLRADGFLAKLIGSVLERTPVTMHIQVRRTRDRLALPLEAELDIGASGAD